MLLNQYGAKRGVQEVSGIINLTNPIGVLSLLFFFVGVWFPFHNKKFHMIFGSLGVIGMVSSEIYNFFTWYVPNAEFEFNIVKNIHRVFPEFYVGLIVSVFMVIVYFYFCRKWSKE